MDKELFDDLVAACHEAIEHERGNIQLKSNTVTISNEEIELHQLIHHKISGLSRPNKQRVVGYVDGLLQNQTG